MIAEQRSNALLYFQWLFGRFLTTISLVRGIYILKFYARIEEYKPFKYQTKTAQLELSWRALRSSTSCSLLKKHLAPDVYSHLKDLETSSGATLLDIIRSGVINLDSGVGVYATDAESYSTFAPLFLPIIDDYHRRTFANPLESRRQPNVDFGTGAASFKNLDPEGKFILSTRIRCARNLLEYPFNPMLSSNQYIDIENKLKRAFKDNFYGEVEGTYYPLLGMKEDTKNRLIDDHFLFKSGDRFLEAANANRYWPVGRGIFHNPNKTFLVWVNEEDHLRIISMEQGADLNSVYTRLVTALDNFEARSNLSFARDQDLGYLTSCPTNLGTTIRASVHIRLPKTAEAGLLESTAENFGLQVRGTRGEHSSNERGVYDISNQQRLGLTEHQAVTILQEGVLALIKLEKSLN